VLGRDLDLEWLKGRWLQSKQIGYWGDIDTWDSSFWHCSAAIAHVDALMMTPEVYEQYSESGSSRTDCCGKRCSSGLNDNERALYKRS